MGHNFAAITCESCKAFFRRNALSAKKFSCPFSNSCEISIITRRFCQKCRLEKCFAIGMKKEYIMSDEDKILKRMKIDQNRAKRRASNKTSSPCDEKKHSKVKIKEEWSPSSNPDVHHKYQNHLDSNFDSESDSSSIHMSSSQVSSVGHFRDVTSESSAEDIVNAIVATPKDASHVIMCLMRNQKEALSVMSKVISSPDHALTLISHFIQFPASAMLLISKIMNSPLDALSVFTQFMRLAKSSETLRFTLIKFSMSIFQFTNRCPSNNNKSNVITIGCPYIHARAYK